MRNIKITISYHGGNFFGWQKQDGKRTVQGVLEEAIFRLCGQVCEVVGSGRTDRGVHALAQVANFFTDSKIPIENLAVALNNLLPDDVQILDAQEVSENFNARFCAKKKTYQYVVQVGGQKNALDFNRVAFCPYSVNFKKMKSAAKLFVGKHNFHAFASSGAQTKSFEREIFWIKITKKKNILRFDICGNGFLYNMVRIIVGTLLDVGRGARTEEDIKKALTTGERALAGKTMPPCGLYLKSVQYPHHNKSNV